VGRGSISSSSSDRGLGLEGRRGKGVQRKLAAGSVFLDGIVRYQKGGNQLKGLFPAERERVGGVKGGMK